VAKQDLSDHVSLGPSAHKGGAGSSTGRSAPGSEHDPAKETTQRMSDSRAIAAAPSLERVGVAVGLRPTLQTDDGEHPGTAL